MICHLHNMSFTIHMLIQLSLIHPNRDQGEWKRNKDSLLSFLETARGALHGLVTNSDQFRTKSYQLKSILAKVLSIIKSLLTNCDRFRGPTLMAWRSMVQS